MSASGRGTWANNDYGFFWLDWCPQADDVGERELSGIKRELKKKLFMEINGIFMAIHVQNTDVVHTDDTEGHGWWLMIIDDWWLIIDCLHTENADDTDVRKRTMEWNANYRELIVN